jgi:hypothetical protein
MNIFNNLFYKCPVCQRPLNSESNIPILRKIMAATGIGGSIAGACALPLLGFGLGGIIAGSFAASIQGPAVAAGSLFAILQSLGATGMGILLVGSVGAAVGVLSPLTAKLGWCSGNCDHATPNNQDQDQDQQPAEAEVEAEAEESLNEESTVSDNNVTNSIVEPQDAVEASM